MATKKATETATKTAVKKTTSAAKAVVKPAVTPVAKPPVKAAEKTKKPKKEAKQKVVRDSFTMPQEEYQKIAEIKAVCLKAGLPVKKSEVLRAGLKALAALNAAQLKRALSGLEKIKTGRPSKP
ncbi:MAG TPA: hypothetical protein VFW53_10970 [Gallionella sp.]|nr:hypothetical protein [Gallionella sp.]